MPSPTTLFLDSHEDPATFMALTQHWQGFRQRGYIFSDEADRKSTLEETKKNCQANLTICHLFRQGKLPTLPDHLERTLQSIIAADKVFPHTLQFLSQLHPEEYQAETAKTALSVIKKR